MWIAEERVIFVFADGSRAEGRLAIGAPQLDGDDASCEIAIEGAERELGRGTYRLHGGSPLQALLIAVQFQAYRLHDFLSRGGRVLDPTDGEDLPLEAYFGPLLRAAVAPRTAAERMALLRGEDDDDDD